MYAIRLFVYEQLLQPDFGDIVYAVAAVVVQAFAGFGGEQVGAVGSPADSPQGLSLLNI